MRAITSCAEVTQQREQFDIRTQAYARRCLLLSARDGLLRACHAAKVTYVVYFHVYACECMWVFHVREKRKRVWEWEGGKRPRGGEGASKYVFARARVCVRVRLCMFLTCCSSSIWVNRFFSSSITSFSASNRSATVNHGS